MKTETKNGPAVEIWRAKQVMKVIGCGRVTLWKRVKAGTFPRPVRLGGASSIGWRSDEVMQWINTRERV